jgi:small subunit ribosomal protein S4
MCRYRGPRLKKIRLWELYHDSLEKCLNPEVIRKRNSIMGKEQYRIHLQKKHKLCFHYGLTERQLLRYVHIAGKAKRSTGQVLLQLLEMCLDNVLFRLGMASTIPGAWQLVNHRHILVNGCIVDIPSFRSKP